MGNEDKRIIHRALISVYSKDGLLPLAQELAARGVEIVSTGGTASFLEQANIAVRRVEGIIGFPAIFGGRVKTLHPKIFGGLLYQRELASDCAEAAAQGIEALDMLVVDLYPFEESLVQEASHAELIEKIDIGGVALLRAAAKNYRDVLVVSSREQYARVQALLEAQEGSTQLRQRLEFAAAAFQRTQRYDALIASYMLSCASGQSSAVLHEAEQACSQIASGLTGKIHRLRYGENPHQQGVFVGDLESFCTQHHGKELSYNNLLDLDGAFGLVSEYEEPTVAIVKHGTPCGLATGATIAEAWARALACDPQSAYGGVIVANRPIDEEAARGLDSIFFEVALVPSFSEEALKILQRKKNRILLTRGQAGVSVYQVRSALNGYLVQTRDGFAVQQEHLQCVTQTQATPEQLADMLFAMRAVKYCKSNAIAVAHHGQLIGVGAGQMNRVDAVHHAIAHAQAFHHALAGSVLASDAFFPFSDSVETAIQAGIKAFIQPGGSIRDADSVRVCNAHGVPMYFTGHRHFRH